MTIPLESIPNSSYLVLRRNNECLFTINDRWTTKYIRYCLSCLKQFPAILVSNSDTLNQNTIPIQIDLSNSRLFFAFYIKSDRVFGIDLYSVTTKW